MNTDDFWDDIEDSRKDDRDEDDYNNTELLSSVNELKERSKNITNLIKDEFQHLEIEDERSNGDRTVYINRKLIFSDRYINAI